MSLRKTFQADENAVFGKTMKNVRKHGDIEFVTTERRRTYLASHPNYHTAKFCRENLLAIEMKKKNPTSDAYE